MKGHELGDKGIWVFLYNALLRNNLAEKQWQVDKEKKERRVMQSAN